MATDDMVPAMPTVSNFVTAPGPGRITSTADVGVRARYCMQLHASRIAGNLAVTDAVLGEAVCIVTKAANVMNGIKNNSGLLERMDAKLDALAADVGGIKSEVGGIKAQVEAVKEDVGGVKAKLGVVEAKVEHIDAKLEDMRRVLGGIKAGQDNAPRPS